MNRTVIVAVAATLPVCLSLAGCNGSAPVSVTSSSGLDRRATTTVLQPQEPVLTTAATAGRTGSTTGQRLFVWHPEVSEGYGSHAANRCADGIIDGKEGLLYYQGVNPDGDSSLGVYVLDEKTKSTVKLADDCFGMINVAPPHVFYRGYPNGWLYRYTLSTGEVRCLYAKDDVWNILAIRESVYFIDRNHNLRWVSQEGGKSTIVASGVAGHYLEHRDGYVHFGRMNKDAAHCDLYRVQADSSGEVDLVCRDVGYIMGIGGTKVLYGDEEGVRLRDRDTGTTDTVFLKGNGALLAAMNGNGVFYVTRDREGYSELKVFDVETKRTITLMPVHCATVSFANDNVYLVSITGLGFERAVLDTDNPHTEWVVEGGASAR